MHSTSRYGPECTKWVLEVKKTEIQSLRHLTYFVAKQINFPYWEIYLLLLSYVVEVNVKINGVRFMVNADIQKHKLFA